MKLFMFSILFCIGCVLNGQVSYVVAEISDSTYALVKTEIDEDGQKTTTEYSEMDSLEVTSLMLEQALSKYREFGRRYIRALSNQKEAKKLRNISDLIISDTSYFKYTDAILLPGLVGDYVLKEDGQKTDCFVNNKGKLKSANKGKLKIRTGNVFIVSDFEVEIRGDFFGETVTLYRQESGIYVGKSSSISRIVLKSK